MQINNGGQVVRMGPGVMEISQNGKTVIMNGNGIQTYRGREFRVVHQTSNPLYSLVKNMWNMPIDIGIQLAGMTKNLMSLGVVTGLVLDLYKVKVEGTKMGETICDASSYISEHYPIIPKFSLCEKNVQLALPVLVFGVFVSSLVLDRLEEGLNRLKIY